MAHEGETGVGVGLDDSAQLGKGGCELSKYIIGCSIAEIHIGDISGLCAAVVNRVGHSPGEVGR